MSLHREFHPLANIFPLMDDGELAALKEDIARNGLREPIVLFEHKILDGRNRELAAGSNARFVEYSGDDPLGFVISANLRRRHLNESQRAMVAANIENLKHGGRRASQDANLHLDRGKVARMLSVSPRSVASAREVKENAVPELRQAVELGHISVSAAASASRLPAPEQRKALDKGESGVRTAAKRVARQANELRLAEKIKALPNKQYGLIYADPAWQFKVRSEIGMDRAADNHYPTSELLKLMRLNVRSIAAPSCILAMWVPVPLLIEAICVADAWGFCLLDRDPATGFLMPDKTKSRYVSNWAWLKLRIITGYWVRGKHELLLIFTRGNPVPPAMGDQLPSWLEGETVEIAATKHSAKPEVFLQWLEQMWPNTPKIELNRRGPRRPDWDPWGNEAVVDDPPQADVESDDP